MSIINYHQNALSLIHPRCDILNSLSPHIDFRRRKKFSIVDIFFSLVYIFYEYLMYLSILTFPFSYIYITIKMGKKTHEM